MSFPEWKEVRKVTEPGVASDRGVCNSTDLDLGVLWFLGVRKFIYLVFGVIQVQRKLLCSEEH